MFYIIRSEAKNNFTTMNIVHSLVEAGADIHAAANNGEQPIHSALLANNYLDATVLLSFGARADAKMTLGGVQPIHIVIAQRTTNFIPVLKSAGADMNAPCALPDNPTPLILAVEAVRTLAQLLVDH